MTSNELTSLKNKAVEPVQSVQQMDICQINAYRKDLSWLHFRDWPRVQKGSHFLFCFGR